MNKLSALILMALMSVPVAAQAASTSSHADEEVIVTTSLEAIR